jgi:hypothetical protein
MARKQPKLTLVGPAVVGKPTPPPGLASDGLELWTTIRDEYDVSDSGGLQLLKQAAQCADRIASARRQIDEQGEVVFVKGVPRAHPLCVVERDQRAALTRLIRAMNLDLEPLRPGRGRPPGPLGV